MGKRVLFLAIVIVLYPALAGLAYSSARENPEEAVMWCSSIDSIYDRDDCFDFIILRVDHPKALHICEIRVKNRRFREQCYKRVEPSLEVGAAVERAGRYRHAAEQGLARGDRRLGVRYLARAAELLSDEEVEDARSLYLRCASLEMEMAEKVMALRYYTKARDLYRRMGEPSGEEARFQEHAIAVLEGRKECIVTGDLDFLQENIIRPSLETCFVTDSQDLEEPPEILNTALDLAAGILSTLGSIFIVRNVLHRLIMSDMGATLFSGVTSIMFALSGAFSIILSPITFSLGLLEGFFGKDLRRLLALTFVFTSFFLVTEITVITEALSGAALYVIGDNLMMHGRGMSGYLGYLGDYGRLFALELLNDTAQMIILMPFWLIYLAALHAALHEDVFGKGNFLERFLASLRSFPLDLLDYLLVWRVGIIILIFSLFSHSLSLSLFINAKAILTSAGDHVALIKAFANLTASLSTFFSVIQFMLLFIFPLIDMLCVSHLVLWGDGPSLCVAKAFSFLGSRKGLEPLALALLGGIGYMLAPFILGNLVVIFLYCTALVVLVFFGNLQLVGEKLSGDVRYPLRRSTVRDRELWNERAAPVASALFLVLLALVSAMLPEDSLPFTKLFGEGSLYPYLLGVYASLLNPWFLFITGVSYFSPFNAVTFIGLVTSSVYIALAPVFGFAWFSTFLAGVYYLLHHTDRGEQDVRSFLTSNAWFLYGFLSLTIIWTGGLYLISFGWTFLGIPHYLLGIVALMVSLLGTLLIFSDKESVVDPHTTLLTSIRSVFIGFTLRGPEPVPLSRTAESLCDLPSTTVEKRKHRTRITEETGRMSTMASHSVFRFGMEEYPFGLKWRDFLMFSLSLMTILLCTILFWSFHEYMYDHPIIWIVNVLGGVLALNIILLPVLIYFVKALYLDSYEPRTGGTIEITTIWGLELFLIPLIMFQGMGNINDSPLLIRFNVPVLLLLHLINVLIVLVVNEFSLFQEDGRYNGTKTNIVAPAVIIAASILGNFISTSGRVGIWLVNKAHAYYGALGLFHYTWIVLGFTLLQKKNSDWIFMQEITISTLLLFIGGILLLIIS